MCVDRSNRGVEERLSVSRPNGTHAAVEGVSCTRTLRTVAGDISSWENGAGRQDGAQSTYGIRAPLDEAL